MGMDASGTAWPAVGTEKRTTYGGMSGSATRPIGLKAVSSISNHLPGFPIMATGGVESASTALEYLHAGAPVVQICSAVQNQDLSVIQDYLTGLRAILYINARQDLLSEGWVGQVAPVTHAAEAVPGLVEAKLPRFGPYELQRRKLMQAAWEARNLQTPLPKPAAPPATVPVAPLGSQVGKALPKIGKWGQLSMTEQVVALVDEETCINCGKCYMACNDSGYQAIQFDPVTHLPHVTEDCTGCTICLSVCPVMNCITMVPRTPENPYKSVRGIDTDLPSFLTSGMKERVLAGLPLEA
jgi:dihydropyrimidine dehydrogenase (NADP+)